MSTIKGSSVGSGGGVQSVPSRSRKIVQSLKEVVNCPEAEIYAALKDCNMDPNEAVNRLLCEDPFHEVKSKREKRKEGKDINDSRPRSANNTRGSKGSDRFLGRGGSTSNNYYGESSPLHGKSSFKKDNESAPHTSLLSSAHPVSGKNGSIGSFAFSVGASAENKVLLPGIAEGMPSGVQSSSGHQSALVGVPGQLSMADIVKMGRPPNKAANASNASHHNVQVPNVAVSYQTAEFSEDQLFKTHDSGVSSIQHVPTNDKWPSVEMNSRSVPEHSVDSEPHQEATSVPFDIINRQAVADEVQETEDENSENPGSDDVSSLCISGRSIQDDDIRGASVFENDLYEKMSSYQPQGHDSEHLEVEEGGDSVPSVTKNLQQLSVRMSDRGFPLEGDAPSVVIPDHLQVHSADFSHLSFGSFRSGISATFSSGTMIHVNTELGDTLTEVDVSSLGHQDARNLEYFVDDSLRNVSDGSFLIRSDLHGQNYDSSSAPQPEELKPESAEVANGLQYSFPASKPGHTFVDAQQLNVTYNQTSPQMENLTPFSNAMHSYTNSLSSTLLAANVHPIRESDIQYSPFSLTQPTSSRYGNSASSVGSSAISMSEVPIINSGLKTADLSSTQLGHQNLSGTSVATGPPLPQNLAVHPYSQPPLPLGPYGNMIGYPILPQSYTYMPSAFQQTFLGNSTYHQSLAAMLPQYKNNASVSSLPQSAAIASGYGAFGSTSAVPGNFPVNPPVAPSGTTLSYDDLLNSQFKDSNHLISLQQNENSPIWLHGANSRTMSSVPANTYYSYQGQNQQPGGFRQGLPSSQNYGTVGHPTFYNSQTGMTLDHKNSRDGAGSQVQPKQSQIWQSSY